MKIMHAQDLQEEFFAIPITRVHSTVRTILESVEKGGDEAIKAWTREFDGVNLSVLKVPEEELSAAAQNLSPDIQEALKVAAENLETFSVKQKQQLQDFTLEVMPGLWAGQRIVPLDRVGIYVPGGSFPLVSSLLMGVVPARIAGVQELVVASPPSFKGGVHPAILAAAHTQGIQEFYQIGGVQAIGALAYGTETIDPVHKIVGPGNQYVTQAKKEVFGLVGIDCIAGPSEVLIIADSSAHPPLIAADLLAQAEHDTQSIAILITPSAKLAQEVAEEVKTQLQELPPSSPASVSLDTNGIIILVNSLEEAIDLANQKAPEHLELHGDEAQLLEPRLKHYGSLFIGAEAGEILGDYAAGINHTLPTSGAARYTGGLSVLDFLKVQTTLQTNAEGLKRTAPTAQTLARLEGLIAHEQAAARRLNS